MASKQEFVNYILAQIAVDGEVEAKKMFGEYAVYMNGKIVGLICDDKLFIKPTQAGREYIKNIVEAPPYPGAKPSYLIEEQVEDSKWLSQLIKLTYNQLPEPKPKKKK